MNASAIQRPPRAGDRRTMPDPSLRRRDTVGISRATIGDTPSIERNAISFQGFAAAAPTRKHLIERNGKLDDPR